MYFTPVIANRSGRRVGIALADQIFVRCLGSQGAADSVGAPTAWAYYRLTVATLRVYPTTDRTGHGRRAWGTAQLSSFVLESGIARPTFPGF